MYVCMYVCEFAYSSNTRPNSHSNIEDEVHMTTDIVYVHGLRSRMSLTHVNARATIVHCNTSISVCMVHLKKRYWTNLKTTCKCDWSTCVKSELAFQTVINKDPINRKLADAGDNTEKCAVKMVE
jgi:hypothetical protein